MQALQHVLPFTVVAAWLTTTIASDALKTVGWQFAGPTTYVTQFGSSKKLAAAAAVQKAVQGADDAWFIGSVNGGVWRTFDLHDGPHWHNVLDGQPVNCASISALHYDENGGILYAGCGGSTSSEQGRDWNVVNSGGWGGIMASHDNGDTWNMITAFPVNYYVTDILQVTSEILLVAAQSHLYDRNNGGIWQSRDGGLTFRKVCETPTFTLTKTKGGVILATHARTAEQAVSLSKDQGKSFQPLRNPLPWKDGAIPFYTCAAILQNGQVVVAGLTRLAGGLPNNTDSQIFITDLDKLVGDAETKGQHSTISWAQLQQPQSMDEDAMPKDRMALLGDPNIPDLLYVAGNAGALAWRINVTSGNWIKLWDNDVVDGSVPHADCRNCAWDASDDRLILVTDGGIFARLQPRQPGGKWISLNGDYSALELLSAHYDFREKRYVMGAQDNCAIVTKPNASYSDVGYGFVEGDGAITLVDSHANPSRLFGTTQFLGVGTIYRDPETKKHMRDVDDDDGCGGLCFAQGDKFVEVPLTKYFPEPSSFPFFVHPYTLNQLDPTLLHFWVNGTGPERPSGFYQFHIPYTVRDKHDIGPPTKVLETPPGVMIFDFVSGGYTAGKPDPDLVLAMSNTHLYVRSCVDGNSSSQVIERSLPVKFAEPVTLEYDSNNKGARILGPLTHARTVQMAVDPVDSRIIAVTGWQSIDDNASDESVFLTVDAGETWKNITANLRSAVNVVGKIRPGGLLFVNPDVGSSSRALMVGTSNGVAVTYVSTEAHQNNKFLCQWTRFGRTTEFPIVLVAGLEYEPMSDRIVAATFGRGVYMVTDAKQKLRNLFKNPSSEPELVLMPALGMDE